MSSAASFPNISGLENLSLKLVSILLHFTHALQEGDWLLFLLSFVAMLPWFAAYDHVNYTQWGIIFLTDIK